MTRTTWPARRHRGRVAAVSAGLGALLAAGLVPATAGAQDADPRIDLPFGYFPYSEAANNVELLSNSPRVGAFDANPGNFSFVNSDLAFTGDKAIMGSYHGFQVYDVSDPAAPVLENQFVCPGGQGDVSVYGDLLFMSVEETRGKIDCTLTPAATTTTRFRGIRIFDISDINAPVQLPGVQTCRGSHTHTLVTDPDDPDNIYIYNSGTAGVRSAAELAGCNTGGATSENPTQWRIDVIKVPLAAPQTASIVSQPRIFQNYATGAVNGLQNGPTQPLHPSGVSYSPSPNTNTCHDITAFPEIGLAAGACQGNGILLDISDPVSPVRLDAVADVNYSYWHSATFNNDGTKVVFTDEWGGGTGARCRTTDRPEWGANALFDIVDGKLQFASYYKLPVPQTVKENCVAHNGSIIPVPNRDIMVQAWYQGGMSIFDFTDTANPREIAYYDRGPIDFPNANQTTINLGGFWSTYWYNGNAYGSEIARGFDTFGLAASDELTANEIGAAESVQLDEFNAQLQSSLKAPPSALVVRANIDQAVRAGAIDAKVVKLVSDHLDKAERFAGGPQRRAAIAQLDAAALRLTDAPGQAELKQALKEYAATLA